MNLDINQLDIKSDSQALSDDSILAFFKFIDMKSGITEIKHKFLNKQEKLQIKNLLN